MVPQSRLNDGFDPILTTKKGTEMPTGYTAAIADDITFNDFAMQCARAMGALVMMRDEPTGAPIPERFEPSDYHINKIAETNATILRLAGMTADEAEQAANDAYEAAIAAQAAAIRRNDMLREKYDAMLEKVEAWQPPSADHDGFKKFMVEQITSSIGFDCDNSYYRNQAHTKLTGADWLAQEEAKARKDIAYHESENAKEVERTEGRNRWIKELRDSLKGSNDQAKGPGGFSPDPA